MGIVMIILITFVIIVFIAFFVWAIFFSEIMSHNYYFVAVKRYENLLYIKHRYEITKSPVLYNGFYEYRDKAFKHLSSLYIKDISLFNKIRIGKVIKKIITMQLEDNSLNINKNKVNYSDNKIISYLNIKKGEGGK